MAKLNTIYKFIEVNTGNIQIFFHSTHILKLIIINETEQKHWSNKNHTLFLLINIFTSICNQTVKTVEFL